MKRIVGGILVVLALVAPAGAAGAAVPPPPGPPPMENLWPPLGVSFPLQTTLESNPIRFRCPTWGNVSWVDYTWRISNSSVTESDGLLNPAHVIASGGALAPEESIGGCRAAPESVTLAPGVYYWQVTRPEEPGTGVDFGPVGNFTVGPSKQCKKMLPILEKAKRRVVEDERQLQAARGHKAKRKARERLVGRKTEVIRAKGNRRYWCHGGARGQ